MLLILILVTLYLIATKPRMLVPLLHFNLEGISAFINIFIRLYLLYKSVTRRYL